MYAQPETNFLLTFWSLSETFIRWSWFSKHPVLDMSRKLRVKKMVVAVAEGEAPLISVDCSLAFLIDVHSFLNPSREAVRFPVNDGSIRPIYPQLQLQPFSWHKVFVTCQELEVNQLHLIKVSERDRNVNKKLVFRCV